MSDFRRTLYALARLLGDAEALSKGPAPFARRLARKAIWRQVGRGTQRATKRIGL